MYFKVLFLPLSKFEGILKFRLAPNFICFFFSVMKLTSYHVCTVKRNTIMRKKIHLLLSAISLGSSHGVLNLFFCLLITSLLGVVLKARRTITYQVIFFLFLRHNTCTFYSKMVAYLVLFSSYVGINSYIFLLVFEALWKLFSL